MDSYEKEFIRVQEKTNKWMELFFESSYFVALDDTEKDHAGFAIEVFSQYMFDYEGQEPGDWDEIGLKSCCLDTLPRKVTVDDDFPKALPGILSSYFLFLDENQFISNGRQLSETVINLKRKIIKEFNNPRNWGMAKQFMMGAKSTGVDIADQQDLETYMHACL